MSQIPLADQGEEIHAADREVKTNGWDFSLHVRHSFHDRRARVYFRCGNGFFFDLMANVYFFSSLWFLFVIAKLMETPSQYP
nr:hypothetical protein [Candidatus Sigynarchaeota archaeon]